MSSEDQTPKAGHNSLNRERLTAIVQRIENLRARKATLQEDEKEIFLEAKSAGYDTRTVRKLIQRRAMDKADRDEQDELLHLYEDVVGL